MYSDRAAHVRTSKDCPGSSHNYNWTAKANDSLSDDFRSLSCVLQEEHRCGCSDTPTEHPASGVEIYAYESVRILGRVAILKLGHA